MSEEQTGAPRPDVGESKPTVDGHPDASAAAEGPFRQRMEQPPSAPEDQQMSDIRAQKEMFEQMLDPQKRESLQPLVGEMAQEQTLPPEKAHLMAQKFKEDGITKDQAEEFIAKALPNLDDETKKILLEPLVQQEMPIEEKMDEDASREMAEPVENIAKKVLAEGEKKEEVLNAQLAELAAKDPHMETKEHKEKHKEHHDHHSLMGKLKHFMDATPQEWGVRMGKTLAGISMLVFLAILAELAAINKAVGKR